MDHILENQSPLQISSSFLLEPLSCSGNGAEYVGIWIVHLLLTIGVYPAWAKLRRRETTQVAG